MLPAPPLDDVGLRAQRGVTEDDLARRRTTPHVTCHGTWVPAGAIRLGRVGLVANVLAVLWLAFETVNIAWPRSVLAPPGAPAYQVWAAPLVLALIATAGVAYLLVAKPHRAAVAAPPAPARPAA